MKKADCGWWVDAMPMLPCSSLGSRRLTISSPSLVTYLAAAFVGKSGLMLLSNDD